MQKDSKTSFKREKGNSDVKIREISKEDSD